MKRWLLLLVACLACLPIPTTANWGNNNRTRNNCNRPIAGTRNYVSGLFNVPLSKTADLILGDQMYTPKYTSAFAGVSRKFAQLGFDIHDENVTDWAEGPDGWVKRRLWYGRHLHGIGMVNHASVSENHTAMYRTDQIILYKRVRNLDAFISGILIEAEYCVEKASNTDVFMEVDIRLTIDNPLLALLSDSIEDNSDEGFRAQYGSLSFLMKTWLPKHPEDPVTLKLQPSLKSVDNPAATDATPLLDMPTPPAIVLDTPADQNGTQQLLLFIALGLFACVFCAFLFYHLKKKCCQSKNKSASVVVTFNAARDEVAPTVKEPLISST